jgi:hypothetical protein
LEIHADGTLIFGAALNRKVDGSSLARYHIIDEEEVEHRLAAFATYAGQFYRSLARGELITDLYSGASLSGIDNKTFGKLPPHPLNSFTMRMHGLPNPLKVPATPLRVSRVELADPSAFARRMTEHIARVFRQANAYFTPGSSSRRGGAY